MSVYYFSGFTLFGDVRTRLLEYYSPRYVPTQRSYSQRSANQCTPVPHHNIPPLQPSCPQLAVGVRSQRAGRHTTQCGRWSGVHTVSHVTCESTPRLPLFFLSCRPVHVDLVGGLILLHGVTGRQNQSISRLSRRLQHLPMNLPT